MNFTQRRFILSAALLLCLGVCVQADVLDIGTLEPSSTPLTTYYATMPTTSTTGTSGLTSAGTFNSNLGGFDIVINPGSTLAGNAPALAAFNRAAARWEARISNPVTVNISADLAALGSGVIGSAASTILFAPYSTIRNQMVTVAAAETDDAIVASLPTAAQFTATLPVGKSLDGNVLLTKANAKALGFSVPDASYGFSDASITFSTNFNFDYDNSDGVTAGLMDFETVAAHEIGHALGFISTVDDIDQTSATSFAPTTLDLFRFNIASSPTTAADFTTLARDITPGNNDVTDFVLPTLGLTGTEFRMSTGVTNGDGRQASHWKDDALTGTFIGMLDPTLGFGISQQITEQDFRAMDLIGWNIAPIPEPSTYALGVMGLASLYWLRRKRVSVAA